MIRNFGNLRSKMLMHRAFAYRMNSRCSMPGSLLCRKKLESPADNVTVTDINIHDLAKGDLEFRRNFLTTGKLLEHYRYPGADKPKTKEDSTPKTKDKPSPKITGDTAGKQAPTASDGDGAAADSTTDSTFKFSTHLDLEGKLLNLRNKILVHRATMSRLATSLLCRKQSDLEINIHDLANGDLEFRRSFLTSVKRCEHYRYPEVDKPKTKKDKTPQTKEKSSPKTTGDASGKQAPTASDGDSASDDSTAKFSSVLDLEGALLNLRNKILMHRATMARMATSILCRTSLKMQSADDANVYDCAKGHLEFRRNFLTSGKMLEHYRYPGADKPKPKEDKTPQTKEESSPKTTGDASGTKAPAASDGDGSATDSTVKTSSVLDMNGNQILPIEIDGWQQDGEADPTVQNSTDIDIGNDDEYNAEMSLNVPEKREAEFSYKGITIKLPESASQDIGTYRFRRDAEDLETLADDMRIVKFDKK
ncbi:uncharacterized protein LOC111069137 [Drosophila obscura]|uniref:uncharacterized protein LOC111069137 n=1 Tax=Drosophila obscura TaxID=7282 RepID=UPI001BB25818|nr:uncharacterized protein LOC111069137 [Drosophila obscura]